MKKRNIIAAMVLAVSLVGCKGEETKVATTANEIEVVRVETALNEKTTEEISYNGNIEAKVVNNISSSTPSRIGKIYVEVGDKVRKGDKLVEMDKTQLLQQEMQVANAHNDLLRLEELYKSGGVSKQQLDQVKTQYDVAKKALDFMAENTVLTSPIDGIVTARNYDNGDIFSMTPSALGAAAIVTIMKMDEVKLKINIQEQYLSKITKGMAIELLTEGYPNEVFKGNVSLIYPLVDAGTHTFTAEVTIPNRDMKLRPGMFTNVNIKIGEKDIIVVDDKAIQKQQGSNEKFVFVVENGVAKRRTVKVSHPNGYTREITSGIKAGDKVVTDGASKLLNGSKVKVVK